MTNDQREKHTQRNSQSLRLRRILLLITSVAVLLFISILIDRVADRERTSGAQAQFQPAATTTQQVGQEKYSFLISNLNTIVDQVSATITAQPLLANSPDPSNSATASTTSQLLLNAESSPSNNDASVNISGTIFLSLDEAGYSHIYAYTPTSQGFIRLTNGSWDDITPAVSPDGINLAFSSNRDGQWDLYILNLESAEITRLTRTAEYESSPAWSPDGQWLAYETYVPLFLENAIPLLDEDYTSSTRTSFPGTEKNDIQSLDIFILQVSDADDFEPITIQLTGAEGNEYAPVWSPSGRQIAFVQALAGDHEIWLADLDKVEGRFRNISRRPLSDDRYPTWSPIDGGFAWASSSDGFTNIVVLEDITTSTTARPLGAGSQPVWDPTGAYILTPLSAPNQHYLTAYHTQKPGLVLPMIALPGPIDGLSWGRTTLPRDLPKSIQQISQITPTPPWKPQLSAVSSIIGSRYNIVQLTDIEAPYPLLHDLVDESFSALRSGLRERIGWDYLSTLENAFVPLTTPLFPGLFNDWLYSGRAFAFNPAPINAGWVAVTREDYGPATYWRVYVRTRYQDGTQGRPLYEFPWDFKARYSGDTIFYEQGGTTAHEIPGGYWEDLTRLAQVSGWQRLPALSSWRYAYGAAQHNTFVLSDGLDWLSAMAEIYPAEALATPTKVIPPTFTPTKTRWPTQTPTFTRTPWPSRTPSPATESTTPTP